ncbi:MAG: RidA family protein [Burkholderiaceae bacterium]
MSAEDRLRQLGISLPQAATPVGAYVPGVLVGNVLFMSGHGPFDSAGRVTAQGKVGRDMSVEQAAAVAREVALNMLGSVRQIVGSLDRVARVVKVLGMVNCVEGFTASPKVIDGFSGCLIEVFGDDGRHARSAVGVMELPAGIPVEVEAVFEIRPD